MKPNPFVHPTQWDIFASDPDHADLIDAFSELTSNIRIETGNKMSQKQRKNAIPRLTAKMIASIAKQVKDGVIQLPEIECHHDDDYFAIWALVDSGSSVHAIDADKYLPNAKKQKPPPGHKGFKAANGEIIPHGGFVSTDVRFKEGNGRTLEWNNAKVEMPILSTKKLNKDGGRTVYDEDEGWILNKLTGDSNHFIGALWCVLLQALPAKAICAQ